MRIRSSATQLFNGQTTHALSAKEIDLLYIKMRIQPAGVEITELFEQIIDQLNKTPTGAQKLRQMLKADEFYHIDFTGKYVNNGADATYLVRDDVVALEKPDISHQTPDDIKHTAISFAHEITHDLQNIKSGDSRVLLDTETQALEHQLALEMGISTTSKDLMKSDIISCKKKEKCSDEIAKSLVETYHTPPDKEYKLVYNACYKMWKSYADKPETTPKGFLKFKPKKGVNVEEAKKAYAQQMASYHARALYAKEFTNVSYSKITHKKNKYFKAEKTQNIAHFYRHKDEILRMSSIGVNVNESLVKDMQKRNPFIRKAYYDPIKKSREKTEDNMNKKTDENSNTAQQEKTLIASPSLVQVPATQLNNETSLNTKTPTTPHPPVNQLAEKLAHHSQSVPQDDNQMTIQQHTNDQGRTA